MALPVTPRTIKSKLMVARDYYTQKERWLYCDVLEQELENGRRLIAENQDFAAFAPFASRFPFEMRVLPKFHGSAFSHFNAEGKLGADPAQCLAEARPYSGAISLHSVPAAPALFAFEKRLLGDH
jgi:galactose-1-phosphate uridylyltransferase